MKKNALARIIHELLPW